MSKAFFMETTRIDPARTVTEIMQTLAEAGASAILLEYEPAPSGVVAAVSFQFPTPDGVIPFRLPCRWQKVETILKREGRFPQRGDTRETWARRVAWRQILRWVQAQMALIRTEMVQPAEVFFPYIQTEDGRTVYEIQAEKKFSGLLLGEGVKA
jgi:hypothetical protein